jgi:hypothetical protein
VLRSLRGSSVGRNFSNVTSVWVCLGVCVCGVCVCGVCVVCGCVCGVWVWVWCVGE